MSVRVFTNLEMMPGGVRPVLHCSQGDIRPFGFNIKWNGQAYNPEGLCVVAIVKKDGNVATVAGTIEDDKVLFETTPQMTVLDGDCAGIVTFVDGDNPVSTLRFVLAVQKDPTVEAVDSETDPTGWQAIMEAALADAAAAAKAWAVGPNGSGEGTDDNNAKYWAEQAHAGQIQADWDEADPTAVDYIKNKPTIPAPQVQSDWDEADPTAVDYIKNKPTIPAAQVQSDWDEADSTAVDYIKNKPTIPDSADNISYDNTASGLTATNVQDALDEEAGKINDLSVDYIEEEGVDGIWTYRKWNSGVAECFTTEVQTSSWSPQNLFGNGFYRDANNWPKEINFPFSFTNKPSLKCTIQGANGFYFPSERTTLTKAQLFMLCTNQQTNDNVQFVLHAIGTWK